MEKSNDIFFSIIIPTRNRPELFLLALKSVLTQSFGNKEIIIVNDGSTDEFLAQYKTLEDQYPGVLFNYLIHRPNGHGQSYSMNYGADQATGQYLCFLDDDDYWTDNNYLQKAFDHLSSYENKTDLYYSNQKAFFSNGKQQTNNVWIEDLIKTAPKNAKAFKDVFIVNIPFLLTSGGFAHLNCSIFRKKFYQSIKGMDEGIRYECDRDLYIRSIDQAEQILYNPDFMSKHHIPDAKKGDNMSTMISTYQKKIFQLNVYEKSILLAKKQEVRDFCKKSKGYELKHIAEELYKAERYRDASYYARQALGASPTVKWLIYTIYISIKSVIK